MKDQSAQLGQILVEDGRLDPDDLDVAIRESHKTGERLSDILLKMGLVGEEALLRALGRQLGVPFVKLSEIQIPEEIINRIPAKVANHYRLIPVGQHNGTLQVAINDPFDINTLDDIRLMLKVEIEPVLSTRKEIDEAIKNYYGIGADTMESLMVDQSSQDMAQTLEVDSHKVDDAEMAEDAAIVRFVNQVINEAFHDRATDIHVEPLENELRIRYRIDGVLYEAAVPQNIKRFQAAIISRLKIMANMNIAERRLPQDGKIKVNHKGVEYDLRVSSVPTPYGESMAIRILSRDSQLSTIEKLGFDDHHALMLREMIKKPHGILLVTGPTGSGKSTTLYAALSEINDIGKKIITIEDPIEYRIAGVTQIQVQPSIGLTFANCLRTILRQDPDIIMVGEIRDQETAEITIRTALTGHLVFSTLHTNDAAGAFTRLMDMGIEPFLVASSVEGVLAQRLVRVLCPECKSTYKPDELTLKRAVPPGQSADGVTFYRQMGCEACRYTGFRGRTAVYEIIRMNERLRRMIVERSAANVIKAQAMRDGMRPLRFDGWQKIVRGQTTLDEVMRVTMADDLEE
ncbi:MAG: hypothetical protein Kow0059_09660 [Candidatus Sumerlaeia bacterium]